MILLSIDCPKIWSWKSHSGYGRNSWNPLYKEREYVRHQIQSQYKGDILSCPVRIDYLYLFQVPSSKSMKKQKLMIDNQVKHIVRPDLSNCVKFYEDCLKEIVIKDDSLVVQTFSEKKYSSKCQVIIKIYPIGKNE